MQHSPEVKRGERRNRTDDRDIKVHLEDEKYYNKLEKYLLFCFGTLFMAKFSGYMNLVGDRWTDGQIDPQSQKTEQMDRTDKKDGWTG